VIEGRSAGVVREPHDVHGRSLNRKPAAILKVWAVNGRGGM
jgi:hypothetical protein